jgi:hypothetical protein
MPLVLHLFVGIAALLVGATAAGQAPSGAACTQAIDRLALQRQMADELNLARASPEAYALIIEQHFRTLGNNRIHKREGRSVRMVEGRPAVNEAISFLRSTKALPALSLNSCLSQSAQDHVSGAGPSGQTGHRGRDGSDPSEWATRRLGYRAYCGENISYGRDSAREHVIALVVDDGVRSRGHRLNVFNASYRSIGIGVGSHARYRSMTVHVLCTNDLPAG